MTVQKKMSKTSSEIDSKRKFNEQWENELLFIASPSGKPFCIVCESTLSHNRRHDLNRHYKRQHQDNIEGQMKLVLGSELRKEYVTMKKEEIRRRQNIFAEDDSDSEPFSDDETFEVNSQEEIEIPTPSSTRISTRLSAVSVPNSRKRKFFSEPLGKMNKQFDDETEDEFDVIGKNVAYKLRNLPKTTKILAEKFINDILFECEMGNVNKYTKLNLCQTTPTSLRLTNSESNTSQLSPFKEGN